MFCAMAFCKPDSIAQQDSVSTPEKKAGLGFTQAPP
jgi:hypothetical protein